MKKPRPASPVRAPDAATLMEAAVAHLARYAATRAGLARVLERRVARWARMAEDQEEAAAALPAARQAVATVVARLVEQGLLDDAAFAARRGAGLVRAGRSPMAATAALRARGIAADVAEGAVPDDPASTLGAAIATARKRRIGPFRAGPEPDEAGRRRELGVLARAGFPREVALDVLAMAPEEAEARLIAFRRD